MIKDHNQFTNTFYQNILKQVIKYRYPELSFEDGLKREYGYKACIVKIDDKEFDEYTTCEAVEMAEEYSYMEGGSFEVLQILGRPITMCEIVNVLNNLSDNKYFYYVQDKIICYTLFIEYKLNIIQVECNKKTYYLHEQPIDVQEKIANLIDNCY